jgi:hypothetical protein
LTRDEFERRYDATPGLRKAELIEGAVHMPPPARWDQHAGPHAKLVTWLGVYEAHTPGVQLGASGTLRLDLDNEPQPDAAMIIDPARGGQALVTPDDYVQGAPELVAEVAASTVSIDLNAKLSVYRRNGVREYLVWRVRDQAFSWFAMREGRHEALPLGTDGVLRSEVFPGLWLDTKAMAALDSATVLRVLHDGLQTPEHAAFVSKLQSRSADHRKP